MDTFKDALQHKRVAFELTIERDYLIEAVDKLEDAGYALEAGGLYNESLTTFQLANKANQRVEEIETRILKLLGWS